MRVPDEIRQIASRTTGSRRMIGMLLALSLAVVQAGCSTGGGRGRSSVSGVATDAAAKDSPGRGTGDTRTRTDHKESSSGSSRSEYSDSDDYYDDYYDTDGEDDGGGSFLANLLIGLFASGDDGDAGQSNSADRDTSKTDRHNLIVWLSKANLGGDTIKSVSTVSVMYSGYQGERFRGHMGVYYGEGRRGS